VSGGAKERVEALQLVNDEIDQRFDRQDSGTARLESKASIFVGFSAVLGSVLLTEARNLFGYVALGALALAIAGFFLALKPRVSQAVPDPVALTDEYEKHALDAAVVERLLAQLVATKASAFEVNVDSDRRRVFWNTWALRALAAGLVLAVPAFVVGTPDETPELRVEVDGTPRVQVVPPRSSTTVTTTTTVASSSAVPTTPPPTTSGGASSGP
jgi:hypothetical protein